MNDKFTVILFYKFIKIDDPEALKKEQLALARECNLTGRMVIAKEGINATFEGRVRDVKKYQKSLKTDPRLADLVFKESEGFGQAFTRLSIKVRPEIVTLEAGEFDLETETAPTVSAKKLESWYEENKDFVVLDLRNNYEIKAGQFDKTIHPDLDNFRDLPTKLSSLNDLKDKKVVAVCTGGIRCEKATCLLRREGFKDIYQLKDGIHTYIQKYPNKNFHGTLYVFDNRMTTPVVDVPNREIIGRCEYCHTKTEQYASNDSVRPSRKVLCCSSCFNLHQNELRQVVTA